MNPYGKDFFTSKTTWGAIALLVSPLLRMYGLEIDTQVIADVAAGGVGIALVIWGQITRKQEITSVAGVPIKKEGTGDNS